MDNLSRNDRLKNMRNIRSKDTAPEKIVRGYLFKRGLRFRVADKRYPGKPDIVLPRYRAAIFVHGCFWHQHGCRKSAVPKSNQEYWIPKLQRNVERDISNHAGLTSLGWKVIVIWECELKKKYLDDTMTRLENEILSQKK